MNKNRLAVIISILFTIGALVFSWFYLQYVMDHYLDDNDKEEASIEMPATYSQHTDVF